MLLFGSTALCLKHVFNPRKKVPQQCNHATSSNDQLLPSSFLAVAKPFINFFQAGKQIDVKVLWHLKIQLTNNTKILSLSPWELDLRNWHVEPCAFIFHHCCLQKQSSLHSQKNVFTTLFVLQIWGLVFFCIKPC